MNKIKIDYLKEISERLGNICDLLNQAIKKQQPDKQLSKEEIAQAAYDAMTKAIEDTI